MSLNGAIIIKLGFIYQFKVNFPFTLWNGDEEPSFIVGKSLDLSDHVFDPMKMVDSLIVCGWIT